MCTSLAYSGNIFCCLLERKWIKNNIVANICFRWEYKWSISWGGSHRAINVLKLCVAGNCAAQNIRFDLMSEDIEFVKVEYTTILLTFSLDDEIKQINSMPRHCVSQVMLEMFLFFWYKSTAVEIILFGGWRLTEFYSWLERHVVNGKK